MPPDTLYDKELTDTFECVGIWWEPSNSKAFLYGTLTYSPDDLAKLTTLDDYKCGVDSKNNSTAFKKLLGMDDKHNKIIQGLSIRGEKITLFDSLLADIIVRAGGSSTSTFHFKTIFVGAHFNNPQEIAFRQLSIKYGHMDEWIGTNQGQHQQRLPSPVHLGEYTISVENVAAHKEIVVKSTAEEKSFAQYYDMVYYYQNFLSLVIMEPVYPLTVDGITPRDGGASQVRIFFQREGRSQPSHDKLQPQHMSLTYQQIEGHYVDYVKNLLDDSSIRPVLDVFFDYYYKQPSLEANRFLSLTQCIEGFHRLACGGGYMTRKQYERGILEEFKKSIDRFVEEHKIDVKTAQGLKEKLTHVYEFSLNKRLRDLLKNEVVSSFGSLFVIGITINDFATFVVKLRNQLTHPDESPQIEIPSIKLKLLNDKLELFFFTLTLKQIGATTDVISTAIGNQKFQHLRQQVEAAL